jgi:hypothetical protein
MGGTWTMLRSYEKCVLNFAGKTSKKKRPLEKVLILFYVPEIVPEGTSINPKNKPLLYSLDLIQIVFSRSCVSQGIL